MTYGINPPETQANKPVHRKAWFWVLIAIGAVGVFLAGMIVLFALLLTTAPATTHSEQSEITVNTETPAEPETSNVPREWQSALKKASDLARRDYSKEGTYRALTAAYDFPDEAAEYAVENVNADWQENALNKARELQNRDYSRSQIERALATAYNFTHEDVEHAMANLEP